MESVIDKAKLDRDLTDRREAVRQALDDYTRVLTAAVILTEGAEQRHHGVSQVQVQSAKRVLWIGLTMPILTSSDERHGSVTVRRVFEDGRLVCAHIFNSSGWRDTTVTTERGISNAVARLNAPREESNAG